MPTRIYYNPISQHGRRVYALGLELGLDVDWKLVDFNKGEHKDPSYLKLNPNGKVPTLEEDGYTLWESNAILGYLADKKPTAGLYPSDPKERANVNRWLFWESAHFGPAAIAQTWERMMKPSFMKQPPNETLLANGVENWNRYAPVLNAQLEGREWVTGKLSIADFALASIVAYRVPSQIETKPYRHLEAWLERIESRDSWKKSAPKM